MLPDKLLRDFHADVRQAVFCSRIFFGHEAWPLDPRGGQRLAQFVAVVGHVGIIRHQLLKHCGGFVEGIGACRERTVGLRGLQFAVATCEHEPVFGDCRLLRDQRFQDGDSLAQVGIAAGPIGIGFLRAGVRILAIVFLSGGRGGGPFRLPFGRSGSAFGSGGPGPDSRPGRLPRR